MTRYPPLGLLSTFYSLLPVHPMAFTFEKLIVYQKTIDFADGAFSVTESFPRGSWFLSVSRSRPDVIGHAICVFEGQAPPNGTYFEEFSGSCELERFQSGCSVKPERRLGRTEARLDDIEQINDSAATVDRRRR